MVKFNGGVHNLRYTGGSSEEMQKELEDVKSLFQTEGVQIRRLKGLNEKGQYIHRLRIFSEGKPLSLTDLQKRTEDKILYLKKQCLIHKNDADLRSELDLAIKARKFYKKLEEEPQLFAWKSSRKNAKAFYVNEANWSAHKSGQLHKAFPSQMVQQVFSDEEVDIQSIQVQKKHRIVNKIELKRAGKNLNFKDLMHLTTEKVDTLRHWISDAQSQGKETSSLKEELHVVKELQTALEEMGDHVIGFKSESIEKKISLKEDNWNEIKEAFEGAFTDPSIQIKKEKKGEQTFIEVKQNGKALDLSELKELLMETDLQLRAQAVVADDLAQIESIAARQQSLQQIPTLFTQMLPHRSFTALIGSIFQRCAIEPLKYLLTSDTKIILRAPAATEGADDFEVLMKQTFADEASIKIKSSSRAQKVTVKGVKLSKADLIQKTAKKIESLQIALYTHRDPRLQKILNMRVTAANELLAQLNAASHHRSIKQYGCLGVALLVSGIGILLNLAAQGIQTGARKLHEYVVIKLEQRGVLEHKEMVQKAHDLKKLLSSSQPHSFAVAYKKLRRELPKEALVVLNKTLRKMGNGLLKTAFQQNRLADAHFIIKQKLIKNVSQSVLNELNRIPYTTKEEKEGLIHSLFTFCEDDASMSRIIKNLLAAGNRQLAEKLVIQQFQPGVDILKQNTARLLAAKLGSDTILEAAFGIENIQKASEADIQAKVKEHLFIPNSKGKILLHYACEGSNAKFVTAVDKAMRNHYRENNVKEVKSPFHVKDSKGVKPLSLMSMSLAHDMDLYHDTPNCFTNAVTYYRTIKSQSIGYMMGVSLGGQLTNSIGITATSNTSIRANFFSQNEILQGSLGALGVLGWLAEKTKIGKFIAKNWLGYSRELTKYEQKPENRIDGLLIKQPAKEARLLKKLLEWRSAFLSIGGGETRQKMLLGLAEQNTEKVLTLLKKDLDASGAPKSLFKGDYSDRFLDAYMNLHVYKGNQREVLLNQVFDRFSTSEHLAKALEVQINQGEVGKKCVKELLAQRASQWGKGGRFSLEQYKAALMVTVLLADEQMYDRLLAIKPGKMAFDLADGWYATGGEQTSLLHIAATAKNSSHTEYAAIGHKVMKEMTAANRFRAQADPFEEQEKRSVNPTALKRGDKRVGDLISRERANRFDDSSGFSSDDNGFSHVVNMRDDDSKWEFIHRVSGTEQVKLMINLGIATFIQNIVAICAAVGFAQGGPPIAYAATIVSCFSLRSLCFTGTFLGHLAWGHGIADAWERAERKTRGYENRVGVFGNTQESAKSAIKQVDLLKKQRIHATTFMIKEICAQLKLLAADCDDGSLTKVELGELIDSLNQIASEPFNSSTFKKVSEAIRQADLPLRELDEIRTHVLERLQSPELYVQLAREMPVA